MERTRSNPAYAYPYTTISQNYAPNGLNQYASVSGIALSYDLNGNLTSNGSRLFTYDRENRLIGAVDGGGVVVRLTYDPLGRLYETSGGVSGTTRFLYDGDALVGEYDASGTQTARYVHGPGVDEPLVWFSGASTAVAAQRYLFPDQQGSIVAVTDSNAAPIRINSYDEYGVPNTDNLGRFQYTGQIYLPDLGMYYYKARIYASRLGRFLQTDPIGYKDQMGLYAYVGNDPVNGSDPTGMESGSGYSLDGYHLSNLEPDSKAAGVAFSATALILTAIYASPALALAGFGLDVAAAGDGIPSGGRAGPVVRAARGVPTKGLAFEFKYLDRHVEGTAAANKMLSKGEAVHVFASKRTASDVADAIIKRGEFTGSRGGFDRYGLRFEKPIGYRIAPDGSRIPLTYGQLKVRSDGLYHVIPRTGPGQ